MEQNYRIPAYSGEDADSYFKLLDATFAAYEENDQAKKFLAAMAALTPELRVAAKDVYDKEPAARYEELKTIVKKKTKEPENIRIQELLNGQCIGYKRPTDYLRYLRQLMGDPTEDNSPS